jgi:hypothetical protein
MSVFLFHATNSAPKVLKFFSRWLSKLLFSTIVALTLISWAEAAGPLRINPANPRYFFDGNGKAVYLAGSYQNPYNLLSSGTQDFLAYFDFLAQQNHNFTRVWAWEQAPWTYDQNGQLVFTAQPYERTGPATALDGGLKFDITRFNQAYFDQLRDRIIAAGQRGIYVSLILFEGFSTQRQVRQVNPWLGDPFQSENNINSIDADSNRDGRGVEFFTLDSPSVTALQEAFVRKVADTLNDLDNVLYEISGDTLPSSLAWQTHMVDYLKAYEATKPNQHPVGISQFYPKGIAEVFNSSADWIVMQGTNLKPALAGGSKVLFLEASSALLRKNSDQWVWKTFTRGYNPIYPEDSSVSSNVHAAIGQTKAYSQLLNMSSMSPSDTACSNKFCLLSPTGDYLVYLPSRGAVTIDLSAASQGVIAAWFDPATGQTIPENPVSGSKQVRFTSPVGGQSVLQVIANGGTLARPMGTSDIESWSKSVITATSPNYTTNQFLTSARSALQDNTVATPAITPNGGIYSGSVKVTLTTTTSGASIYYTTDGQTPTETSQKYKRAFTLTSSTLVKAIALKPNMNPSAQASAWFSNSGASGSIVATPTITPNGGSFANSVSVTMASATSGTSIHYTTDGSTPTQSSTLYSGPITLTSSATVKAKAFKSGYNASAEASASFTKSSTGTVSSGLVAYWNFDEGNGTTAADSSGNGNHGKLVNGPQWAAGITGKALSFDGIDDNVTVSASSSLGLSNSFTLSAWVFPTAAQNKFTAVMAKNSASDHVYFLYATSWDGYCGNTGAPLAGANITGAQQVICSPSALPLNTWTYLTSTYDGSNLNLYVNGSLAQSVPVNGTVDPSTGPLQIGASYFGEYFQGLIDEVQIYNRALTDTEIQTVYKQDAVNLPFDYAISNSGNRSVAAGSSINQSINTTLLSGISQVVSFSVSGLPSGATGTFSSASCTPTCPTVLTISTSEMTPPGSYPITVTSSGGGLKRSTVFSLSVTLALTVATPTITPNGGSFSDSVSVTMQSATSGTTLYYTIDGSTPTQSSILYTGAITLTSNATVNAKAFKTGYNPSAVAAASFTTAFSRTTGSGTTFYVGTNGNNSYSCSQARNISTPKRNIMGPNGGISCLSSGDTLDIRGGTYDENIYQPTQFLPNGSSSAPTTLKGHTGEIVTIRGIGLNTGSNQQYIDFDNLVIDVPPASWSSAVSGFYIGGGVNNIRLTNSEIKHASDHGIQIAPGGYNNTFINVSIHDNGKRGDRHSCYGMYISGHDNLFERIHVYNNPGYGVHIYYTNGSVYNNMIRYSEINNNGGSESSQFGIIISSGSGNAAYNNSIYNNTNGVQVDYSCVNCIVSGNTIYGNNANGYAGIEIGSGASGTTVTSNTIYNQYAGAINDSGSGTIISGNK